MLNRKLLLVSSGADAPSTIGVAGGQGFGVGVYPGSKAELNAMQLTPFSGFDNPSSVHYGNYQHVNRKSTATNKFPHLSLYRFVAVNFAKCCVFLQSKPFV